jgi:hypothetical protein
VNIVPIYECSNICKGGLNCGRLDSVIVSIQNAALECLIWINSVRVPGLAWSLVAGIDDDMAVALGLITVLGHNKEPNPISAPKVAQSPT